MKRRYPSSTVSMIGSLLLSGAFTCSAFSSEPINTPDQLIASQLNIGPIATWVDGDVIRGWNRIDEYENRIGRTIPKATSMTEVYLIRPTVALGKAGDPVWMAAKAEIGSEGRSKVHYHEASTRAGIGSVIGFGALSFSVANGATQESRVFPVSWYSSHFAPSYVDGSYTSRLNRRVSSDFLDASTTWNLLARPLLDDFSEETDLEHETVAVRLDAGFGYLGYLTDIDQQAHMLEYNFQSDSLRVQAEYAWAEGLPDRWGNEVESSFATLRLGARLTDDWTVYGGAISSQGELSSNNAWADGSWQFNIGTSFRFLDRHHINFDYTYSDRQIANRFGEIVNFIQSERVGVSYGMTITRHAYFEAIGSWEWQDSKQGESSVIPRYSLRVGYKY